MNAAPAIAERSAMFARSARVSLFGLMAGALLVSGCGSRKEAEAREGGGDPALTGALGDQIMVDPDLASQNRGDAALSGGGPMSAEVPPYARTPEAIEAARGEAVRLVGGTIVPAPSPETGIAARVSGAATAAEMALAVPSARGKNCAAKVTYSAGWAGRLHSTFPIYPRAALQEAAGTDDGGCSLRAVNFLTPVEVKDVIDFYHTRAHGGGFTAEYRVERADHVLGGTKGQSAFIVYARKRGDGLTDVDLVVSGD